MRMAAPAAIDPKRAARPRPILYNAPRKKSVPIARMAFGPSDPAGYTLSILKVPGRWTSKVAIDLPERPAKS